MGVLREIRALPEVILKLAASVHRVTGRLDRVIELQKELGPAEARLEDLERGRSQWEAEMSAWQLRIEGKLKASNNAESRARTMLRASEKLVDPFDLDSPEEPETVPENDALGSEEEGLLPVRVGVATDHKANALRFKFA